MRYTIILALLLGGCSATPPDPVPTTDPETTSCQVYYSEAKLKLIFPTATEKTVGDFYRGYLYSCEFNIKDKQHEAMYLATVLTEVGTDLIGVRESLNYSCEALPSIFSYYKENGGYDTDGRCNGHDADQYTIGSKAYANRLGNGSVSSGDGYTYRGGGYAQTTGYYNYSVIVSGVNSHIKTSFTTRDFADNITNTYIANLGGMGYWLQVGAGDCPSMDCVTTLWNKYTDSRSQREYNYSKIMEL